MDKQSRRNRLHKGDIWQSYTGEPTLLSIFLGAVILGLILTAYFLTQI